LGTTFQPSSLKRPALIAAAALAAWVGYGIWTAGRNETMPPPSNGPVIFKTGSALGQRLNGRSWTAEYERITTSTDQTTLDLYGVKNGVIFRDGKPYLRVTAKHMTVNTVTRDFFASGALHVETIGKTPRRTFDTENANWNDALQTLTLPDRAKIGTGAALPLLVGSAVFNVKTGELDMRQVAGAVRFK
jgi:hypothetical protein